MRFTKRVDIRFFIGKYATKEVLRKEWLRLCKEYHPDNGGSAEDMKSINAEYDYILEHFEMFRGIDNMAGKRTEEQERTHRASETMSFEMDEAMRMAISRLMNCPGLIIEIVGCWVWLSGATYANREAIKAAGFLYQKKTQMWYWAPILIGEDGRCHKGGRRGSGWSHEKRQATFGSTTIKNGQDGHYING